MRAARTDKGVSAVGQVVSLKMLVGFTDYDVISNINKHLPDQIRVLGYTKTTAGFDARKHCDKRRYEYVLPVWAFDPTSCRGRIDAEEAELASAANPTMADGVLPSVGDQPGSTDRAGHQAAAKEEIAEATAAAVAAEAVLDGTASSSSSVQQQTHAQGSAMAEVDLPKPNPAQALQQVMVPASSSPAHPSDQISPPVQNGANHCPDELPDQSGPTASSPTLPNAPQVDSTQGAHEGPAPAADTDQPVDSAFVFDEADVQRLSSMLRQYEGTHNFHNFTVRLAATDPSAKRYMLSCKCTGVFDIQVRTLKCSGVGSQTASLLLVCCMESIADKSVSDK